MSMSTSASASGFVIEVGSGDSGSDISAIQDLEKLGYQQELKRTRGTLHILFMVLAITAVPFGLAAPIATSLVSGGPAVMIWGWVFVSLATQPLALSLAEISSKYPTSAGTYYWCFILTSPNRRLLSAWVNGWLTMVGVWTISLSVTFGTAQLLIAGIGIFHSEWEVTPWQTYLTFVAVTIFSTLVGVYFNRILPTIDILCAVWTAIGTIVSLICLLFEADVGRHSVSYVFGHFDSSFSGWTPGWSFCIGLVPSAYTFSAIGMVASMAEEVHDPAVQLPMAFTWAVPIGFVIGILFLLPILFTLPDVEILLSVPGGQPMAALYTLVMGSKGGGFGLWFILFGIGIFCGISISCAASRATWSFARDKAMPFHSFWSRVHKFNSPSFRAPESSSPQINSDIAADTAPLNAYLLSSTIQILLGLIYLGSPTAFNAFVGVAVMALGASFAMPIAISVWNGRQDMADAPFNLGKWGYALNVFAVAWTALELVLFAMPATLPVTKSSMNYASVVFAGFGVVSAAWYMLGWSQEL